VQGDASSCPFASGYARTGLECAVSISGVVASGEESLYQNDRVAFANLNIERGGEELQCCTEKRELQLKISTLD
jgi:hypothetical protein